MYIYLKLTFDVNDVRSGTGGVYGQPKNITILKYFAPLTRHHVRINHLPNHSMAIYYTYNVNFIIVSVKRR